MYEYGFVHLISCFSADAAADKVQVSDQDELPSTESTTHDKPSEDKPSSSDTEATKMSDLWMQFKWGHHTENSSHWVNAIHLTRHLELWS